MTTRLLTLALTATALAVPATAAADTEDDRAQRALEQVSVRMSGTTAVVKERFESTLYYKVCLHLKAKPRVKACRAGETNSIGVGRVSFARFIANHGHRRYVASWTGGGLQLGTASFRG
jgi:hypothetical protein